MTEAQQDERRNLIIRKATQMGAFRARRERLTAILNEATKIIDREAGR